MAAALLDALGVEILPTDRLMVTAWGDARLIDVRTVSPVVRFGRTRVVIVDSTNDERAVSPGEVTVLRRDGARGFEGNRERAAAAERLENARALLEVADGQPRARVAAAYRVAP